MRRPAQLRPLQGQPNLLLFPADRPPTYWTRALGSPPAVYGERVVFRGGEAVRFWDPTRSKLGAALAKGYDGALPRPGDAWLYLGAASGTTASHVADLVGGSGVVFALEKSLRPFARLLRLADRYPNLLPVLADARDPVGYLDRVPPVDGVYVDVAQPDQVAIAIDAARWCLRRSGVVLLALKTSSMGRERAPREHLDRALDALEAIGECGEPIALEPFHRRHFFLEVRPTRRWFAPPGSEARPPGGPRAARER